MNGVSVDRCIMEWFLLVKLKIGVLEEVYAHLYRVLSTPTKKVWWSYADKKVLYFGSELLLWKKPSGESGVRIFE